MEDRTEEAFVFPSHLPDAADRTSNGLKWLESCHILLTERTRTCREARGGLGREGTMFDLSRSSSSLSELCGGLLVLPNAREKVKISTKKIKLSIVWAAFSPEWWGRGRRRARLHAGRMWSVCSEEETFGVCTTETRSFPEENNKNWNRLWNNQTNLQDYIIFSSKNLRLEAFIVHPSAGTRRAEAQNCSCPEEQHLGFVLFTRVFEGRTPPRLTSE